MTSHDFFSQLGGLGQSTTSLAPFAIYIVIAIVVIVGGYIFVREYQKRVHYKSIGIPIEPVRITWENKYAGIEGYLSKVDLLTDDVFESLSLQEGVEVNADILKQLRNENRLHVYFLNITDEQDVDDDLNETYLVSPYALEDIGWLDQKGRRYSYSLWNRIRRRNFYFYKTTEKFTITNPDEKSEDWWIVNPKLDGETKTMVGFKGNKTFQPLQHVIESTVIEGGRKLSKELSFVTFLAKALEQNQEYKSKAELFEKLHGEKVSQLIGKHIKSERWKMGLTRKAYIVLTKEQFEKDTGVNAIWIAVGGLITGITGFIFPDLIPQMKGDTAQMLGWVVGLSVVMLLFKVMSDKKKKEEFDESASVEV